MRGILMKKLLNNTFRVMLTITRAIKTKPVTGFVLTVFCLTATLAQASDFPALDEAYQSIPDSAVVNQITLYAPIFDFDGDGCLPAAAISRDGDKNGGLSTTGTITGDCRCGYFLDESNTYHRYVVQYKNGVEYSAHLYDMYFEKDQVTDYFGGGHRHDVETVIVYCTNSVPTHMAVSAHGDYTRKAWADLDLVGTHPKVVYHKEGGLTHAFRHATDSSAENPYGQWVLPDVVSWYEMTGDGVDNEAMRNLFNTFDYGSASFKFKDADFINSVNKSDALPSGYPVFTQANADQSQHGQTGVLVQWTNHIEYTTTEALGTSTGRYVKVSIPTTEPLSLAEVQVIDIYGNNVALGKTATQSTTSHSGVADRAVDGNTSGYWGNGSVTHTTAGLANPWWEVDLDSDIEIAEIRVYNRTDCCGSRLNGAQVEIITEDEAAIVRSISDSWTLSGGRNYANGENPSYILTIEPGAPVTIDLTSNIDTYLYIEHLDGSWRSSNDDGGDGTDSRLTYSSVGRDKYRLVAATYDYYETGNFNLEVSNGSLEVEEPGQRQIKALAGSWTSSGGRDPDHSGNPSYILTIDPGASLTVDLRSSADTYLYMEHLDNTWQDSDDDSGSGTEARLSYSSVGRDQYRIIAATYSSGVSANFVLEITNGSLTKE